MPTKRNEPKPGVGAEEATGQIPIPEDEPDVTRSENNPRNEHGKEPTRRRTYGQPVPVTDRPRRERH